MSALCCYFELVEWLSKRAPNHSLKMIEPVPHAHLITLREPSQLLSKMGPWECGPKPRPQAMVAGHDSWAECGQGLGLYSKIIKWKFQKVELKFGRFVARLLARKWPERRGSKSALSKESIYIGPGLAKNLGRFLDTTLATLWPHFFFNVSAIASPMFHWRASISGRILGRSLEL